MLVNLFNSTPNPVLMDLGFLHIYWYGVIMALAMLSGIITLWRLGQRRKLSLEQVVDLSFWLIFGALLGARLYHVLIHWNYYQNNLLEIPAIWRGGLAIHGAIIGGALVLWLFGRAKQEFIKLVSLAAPCLILGQAIGRWGNYFNQELFGRPTNLPWGIFILEKNRPELYADYSFFHPVFLYESILNFILFIILFILAKKSSSKRQDKIVIGVYFLGYGLIRFLMEYFRIDETLMIGAWRWPAILSLALALGGVIIIVKNYKKIYAQ